MRKRRGNYLKPAIALLELGFSDVPEAVCAFVGMMEELIPNMPAGMAYGNQSLSVGVGWRAMEVLRNAII